MNKWEKAIIIGRRYLEQFPDWEREVLKKQLVFEGYAEEIAENVSRDLFKENTLNESKESDIGEIGLRMIASLSGIPVERIFYSDDFTKEEQKKIREACDIIDKMRVKMTFNEMIEKILSFNGIKEIQQTENKEGKEREK